MHSLITGLQKLRWTIRNKMALAFTPIVLCFILNGTITVILLSDIKASQEQQKLNTDYSKSVQNYALALKSEQELFSDLIFVNTPTNSNIVVNDRFYPTISDSLSTETEKKNLTAQQQGFIKAFARLYAQVSDHFSTLNHQIAIGDLATARNYWKTVTPDFNKINELLDTRGNQLATEQGSLGDELSNKIVLSVVVIISLSLISLMLLIFLLVLIERVLVRPLNLLQVGLTKLAAGELEQQIVIANEDEVGKLAKSFKLALGVLKQVITGVRITSDLQSVTYQLTSVSKQQAHGANKQLSAITEIAATMQQLGRSSSHIAESSAQVATLSSQNLEQIGQLSDIGKDNERWAQEMISVTESTLKGVESVQYQISQFSQTMEELGTQSKTIGAIIVLLSSIAKEIHLLALNAAIEAAGGGAASDRFKIVARQVKELATRANEANTHIDQIVGNVQTSIDLALKEVQLGYEQIAEVVKNNTQMRSRLQALQSSAERVNVAVGSLVEIAAKVNQQTAEIEQATYQQYSANEQIIASARAVEEVAEETVGTGQQIVLSSTQLEDLTNKLNFVLRQMQL